MKDEDDVAIERGHGSGAKYVFALVALLILTAITFGLHYVPMGTAGPLVALGIAGTKVVVVGLIFMELRESMAATRLVAVVTVLFVAVLCLGIAGDIAYR